MSDTAPGRDEVRAALQLRRPSSIPAATYVSPAAAERIARSIERGRDLPPITRRALGGDELIAAAARAYCEQRPASDEEINGVASDLEIPLRVGREMWRACESFHGISPPQASERKDDES